MYTVIKAELY